MRALATLTSLLFLFLAGSYSYPNPLAGRAHPLRPADTSAAQTTCDANPEDGYTQSIRGLVDGDELVLTVSARFGGAVESLTWRGKEFINIFDHGRQISYAWQMDGHGECLNPTEPGSASDLFAPTSTSELLEVCRPQDNLLSTTTRPAFWLAPGETGFCDGGTTTAVNDTLVSDHILHKTVEIGYGGIENVIAFTAEITTQADYSFMAFEAPTGYLREDFTNYWRFDPLTGELSKPESQELVEPWSFVHAGSLPPILATEDGQYAMGAYSPDRVITYEILRYDVPDPDDRTNKWNVIFHESPAPAGVYTYRTFVVVGTLEQVVEGMRQIFDLHPTDLAPPEGYIDLLTCDVIEGWGWDPKTPDEPVEIEIRYLDEAGNEVPLTTVTADIFRQDLADALGDNGRHGFSVPTAEVLPDGAPYTLRVYALNSNPNLPPRPLIPAASEIECPQLQPPTDLPAPTAGPPTSAPADGAATEEPTEPVSQDDGEGGAAFLCAGAALPLVAGISFLRVRRKRRS